MLRTDDRIRCRLCNTEWTADRRSRMKQRAVDSKGGRCNVCGYDKCLAALEFHHDDPTNKLFGLSIMGFNNSWEKLKPELDKCTLLCANCHRELKNAAVTQW